MSLAVNTSAATTVARATRWDSFRILLREQRADCLQQRELALAETATSMPDPVATSRVASLLYTLEEIDAALQRITDGLYGVYTHCRSEIRSRPGC